MHREQRVGTLRVLSPVPLCPSTVIPSLAQRLGERGDESRIRIMLRDVIVGAVAERDLAADDDPLRERVVIGRDARAGPPPRPPTPPRPPFAARQGLGATVVDDMRTRGNVRAGFVSTIGGVADIRAGANAKDVQSFIEQQLIDAGERGAVELRPTASRIRRPARETHRRRRRRCR